MELLSLNKILHAKRVTREKLDKQCKQEDRNFIARWCWNTLRLAPYIGLTFEDAEDYKDVHMYQEPQVRRMNLLKKWNQRYGSEATYLKLAEGFVKIDRRDIVEKIIDMSCNNHNMQHGRVNTPYSCWVIFGLVMMITLLGLGIWLANDSLHEHLWWKHLNTTNDNTSTIIDNKNDIGQFHEPITWNAIPCKVKDAPSNLPNISNMFIGRDEDITAISIIVMEKHDVHIININGPPGFGKSSLAIHVGHELVRRCYGVRFIDTTEHDLFKTKHSFTNVMETSDIQDIQQLGNCAIQTYNTSHNDKQEPNLLKWVEDVDYPTLLILDNCDEVLHSRLRDDFIQSVQSFNKLSHGNVKTIITSQEQLLLIDNFQNWTIGELHLNDSVHLLATLAPDIPPHDAEKVTKEVGGCPLALRVIGRMLNMSGLTSLPTLLSQLQINSLHMVDKVSDKGHRFSSIMDIAYGYLSTDQQRCAGYTSLFPGSFDSNASHVILSQFLNCPNAAEHLTRRSLLEEYFLHVQQRFKMHKLIREYFKAKSNKTQLLDFNYIFNLHYSAFLLNYTMLHLTQGIDDIHEHRLVTESHNTLYLSRSIKENPFTQLHIPYIVFHKFSELLLHLRKPQHYNNRIIEEIFIWTISQDVVTFICKVLNEGCASYYNAVFENIHEAVCGSSTVELISCESLYTCDVAEKVIPICVILRLNDSHFCVNISQSCITFKIFLNKPFVNSSLHCAIIAMIQCAVLYFLPVCILYLDADTYETIIPLLRLNVIFGFPVLLTFIISYQTSMITVVNILILIIGYHCLTILLFSIIISFKLCMILSFLFLFIAVTLRI